jgi:hypothetical protein
MSQPLPSAGWYPDPSGASGERYFDGTDWTEQFRVAPPPSVPSDDLRSAVLDRAVMLAVSRGGRVESRSLYQAIIVYGQPPNNVLHAVLSLLTFGLWLLVWLTILIFGQSSERRQVLEVDSYGNLLASGFVGGKWTPQPVKLT